MHSSEYLYGIKPIEFVHLPYMMALKKKLDSGKKLHDALYFVKKRSYEQEVRLFYVRKAIKHTQKLIDEANDGIRHGRGRAVWIKTLLCKMLTMSIKILQCRP